jgi:hypothetical protein
MISSERRENDRAFPACVTNLHIIAMTHHHSVVRGHATLAVTEDTKWTFRDDP